MRPGGEGIRRMMESEVTLLPQPDSPTRPSVLLSPISKLTPSMARTSPSGVKNDVRRFLTWIRSAMEETDATSIQLVWFFYGGNTLEPNLHIRHDNIYNHTKKLIDASISRGYYLQVDGNVKLT